MGLFSKIINAFKSIQMNEKNPVNGQRLDHLLVGSMYAEQQGAYLNSYVTGLNKGDIKTLIEDYWLVTNTIEANKILEDLLVRNQNQNNYLNVLYNAIEDETNYVTILKSGLPTDDETFTYYLDIYRNIKRIVPDLIEEKVITNFAELKKIKDSGWNFGRAVFLARCCYEMGYISENELISYIEKAHSGLKNYCQTWKQYTQSYTFGRAIWGGSNNSGMVSIAESLLNNDKSPLKNKTYL